jgi:hypothetical protein
MNGGMALNLASVTGVMVRAFMNLTMGLAFGLLGPPGSWTGAILGPLGRKISEGPHALDELFPQK